MKFFLLVGIIAVSCCFAEEVCLLAPASSYPIPGCSMLADMVNAGEFKKAIEKLDEFLQAPLADNARAFLLVEKAKLLFVDQQQMESQDVFLQALQQAIPMKEEATEDEASLFQSLFSSYEESLRSPDACVKLVEQAEEALKKHKDYTSIEFYVAAGLANRGRFTSFYDRFFHAFLHRSGSFLAWKTRGVLHLRLYEASSSDEMRVLHRKEAVACFQEAFRRQPQDASLLVKLVFILPCEEKKLFLEKVADDFVRLQTPPKRGDCFFLIEQALDVQATESAKKLIDKARVWYQYSRALNDLSERYDCS
jgi:tetratricopeptide (TPR) repeat protein